MKGVPRPWSGSTVRGRPDSAYSGGVRGPCLPASSDRLHRIQVAQPQGDPSGIISLRVRWSAYPAPRAMSRPVRAWEAIRVRVIPLGARGGWAGPTSSQNPGNFAYPSNGSGPRIVSTL